MWRVHLFAFLIWPAEMWMKLMALLVGIEFEGRSEIQEEDS